MSSAGSNSNALAFAALRYRATPLRRTPDGPWHVKCTPCCDRRAKAAPRSVAMDKNEIVRFFDRKLKIRTMHVFDRQEISIPEYEREFALTAIDLMCRQPVMADLIE